MTIDDAIRFCDEWLPSWSGNDPDRLIAFYTGDAFYLDPTVKAGLQGHDQIKAYFMKLLKNNPEWRWTHEEVFPTEKGFILKWKARIPVGDATIVEYGMDIVEMRDGRIARNEVYFDSRELVAAIRNLKK